MSSTDEQLRPADKLLFALISGPVTNTGGVLMDCFSRPLGFDCTELYGAVQELGSHGIAVVRTDSGGHPTWARQ